METHLPNKSLCAQQQHKKTSVDVIG